MSLVKLPTIICPETVEEFRELFTLSDGIYHCYLIINAISAKMILDNFNLYNRALKNPTDLVNALSSDTFLQNGDTISFTSEPNLIDGQHRLKAIIESNKETSLQSVFGLEQKAIYTKDKGTKRQRHDDITIIAKRSGNEKHQMSSAEHKVFKGFIDGATTQKYKNLSYEEINKLWTTKYNEAVRFGISCFPAKTAPGLGTSIQKSIIARAYYCGENKEKLQEFCNKLILGQPSKKGCPVEALYKKSAKSRNKQGRPGNQFDKYKMMEVALNAYLSDREIFTFNTAAWHEFYDIADAERRQDAQLLEKIKNSPEFNNIKETENIEELAIA